MIYQRSSQLFAEAEKVIPGGVNSPVRAFKAVGGTPIFVKRAQGAYLYDEDGNRLIDYINSWGPMILGHAYEPVVEAVTERAKLGTSFGMPTELETKIAALAVSMVPNIDKIRFVNSGTEACMSAIRLARGFTKRDKIIKFAGCYHGHSDSFLIAAGSGLSTFGVPNSPGVTEGTAKDTLLARYNDLENVSALIAANPNEIAAIIVEPVAGNMGCVPPLKGFLEGLRELCSANGILLIFDEVMSVLITAIASAPFSSTILAISTTFVTFGESFTIKGFVVTSLTSLVTFPATSGFAPKAIPPSFTFGQEILSSIAAISGIASTLFAISTYSSIVFPLMFAIESVFPKFSLRIFTVSFSNTSIPGFSSPIELSIPPGVSAILVPAFPVLGSRVSPLRTTAPKSFGSK